MRSSCAVALAALRKLRAEPERVAHLRELSDYMRGGLKARGLRIREGITPIVPIFTQDALNTLRKATELYHAGVYVNTVLPPAAPADGCMLRCSIMATHTKALLDEAMDIMQQVIGAYED